MADQTITTLEQHTFYMLLFHLIFRYDNKLRLTIAEKIRLILQNPVQSHTLPPAVLQLLRQLRADLLTDPLPEIVATLNQPPVRLVDDDFSK
jgi:hypothetical protein